MEVLGIMPMKNPPHVGGLIRREASSIAVKRYVVEERARA
jgi:hypothetical protein